MGTPSESAGREFDRPETLSHKAGEWTRAALFAGTVLAPIYAVKGINAVAKSETAKSAAGVVGHVARAAAEVGIAAPLRYIARPNVDAIKYSTALTARYAGQDLQAAKDGVSDVTENMKYEVEQALRSLSDALWLDGPKDAHN